ncbi:MAG: hypothetical protein GY751_04055 [Bacteroidetes bacterium]|nr:hypothetical protein [Bacteroidota bacterium]
METLISEYPYVSVYRVLLAKLSQPVNGDAYRQALHQAALHSPDRIRLYELLHIPEVEEPEKVVKQKNEKPSRKKKKSKKVEETAKPEIKAEVEHEAAALVAGDVPENPSPSEDISNPPVAEEVGLKDSLMKSAAERNITLDEKHTFMEWLDILENPESATTSDDAEVLEQQLREQQAASSYEATIHKESAELSDEEQDEHGIEVLKKVDDLAMRSIQPGVNLATETLAQIMLKQGKIKDAIAVYEQLSLKYPEKSDYFAALISDLKAR